MTSCDMCLAGSTSPPGSKNASDCSCMPGFAGPLCIACPAGKYKTTAGSSDCVPCLYPSIDCNCVSGHTFDLKTSRCEACPPGTFKEWSGPQSCTTCPEFSTSGSGSGDIADCLCLAGYESKDMGEFCVACAAGKYKHFSAATGPTTCTSCTSGTYSAAIAGNLGVFVGICAP